MLKQMSQPQTSAQIYYEFFDPNYLHIFSQLKVAPLTELAMTVDGRKVLRDGRALEKSASEQDYLDLEARLGGDLQDIRSGQSYGSVGLNDVGGRFISIAEYVSSLEQRFETDPEKVRRLRIRIIEHLAEKLGGKAFHYIPKDLVGLYKEVTAQREQKQGQLQALETPQ